MHELRFWPIDLTSAHGTKRVIPLLYPHVCGWRQSRKYVLTGTFRVLTQLARWVMRPRAGYLLYFAGGFFHMIGGCHANADRFGCL